MGTLYKFIENLDTNSEEKLDIYSLVNNVIINTTLAEINGMLLQKKAINELIALLAAKDKIYIRILTYELEDEYVSFRIFSQGKWNIKLS